MVGRLKVFKYYPLLTWVFVIFSDHPQGLQIKTQTSQHTLGASYNVATAAFLGFSSCLMSMSPSFQQPG